LIDALRSRRRNVGEKVVTEYADPDGKRCAIPASRCDGNSDQHPSKNGRMVFV